jgi:hypothetical protein
MAVLTRIPLDNNYQSYLKRVIADGGTYEPVPTVQFIEQYNKLLAYNPSLILFPSTKKTGFLYAITPNISSSNFTSSRSSNSGSYFNSNGVLKFAPANEPRLTYTVSTTNQFNGLLIEPTSTNWHLSSQTMGTGMSLFGTTFPTCSVALDTTSPDGTYNAAKVTGGSGSAGSWGIFRVIPQGILSGSSICGSMFAKAGTNNTLGLNYANISGPGNKFSYFDLSSGTTPTTGAKIENWGNGWYRCIMAPFTTLDANPVLGFNIGIHVTPNTSTAVWSSDFTGKSMYFYGIQLENYSFATSLIPTTNATASRAVDSVLSPFISSSTSQWTIFFDIEYQSDYAANTGDVNGSPLIWYFRRLNSTQVNLWNQNAQQTLGTFTFSPANSQKRFKCILSFNGSTINTFINGTKTGNQIIPTNLAPFQTLFSAGTNKIQFTKVNLSGFMDGSHIVKFAATYNYQLDDQSSIFLTGL